MKYEKLKKNYTKNIIISLIVIIIIGSVLVLNITKAKYRTTTSINIVNGTVKYTGNYDFKIMALYQQKNGQTCTDDTCYDEIEEMPESGYEINNTKSYCTIDGTNKEYNKLATIDGNHTISKLKKNEKCYLYFNKIRTSEDILIMLGKKSENGATGFSGIDTEKHEGIMYKGTDDFGDTYYFRGAADDNWIKFGDDENKINIWWRIIRINGNGSIRMIYAGTNKEDGNAPDTTGEVTQISGTYGFNSQNNNNAYVGYYYTVGELRGKEKQSSAANQLTIWFEDNLIDEWSNEEGLIDKNAGFCGDRIVISGNSNYPGNGITGQTLFAPADRFETTTGWRTSQAPIFTCTNEADNYTYTEAKTGTKNLTYPVGLITADEVVYAGGFGGKENSKYYLYTNQNYWTMSPEYFGGNYAHVFAVNSNGNLFNNYIVSYRYGLRPVINLKSTVKIIGKGTTDTPYVVQNS